MIVEWFTPRTKADIEWFGQTDETLALIEEAGVQAIASVVGPRGEDALGSTVTLANNTGGHKAVTHDGNRVQTDTLDRYAGVTLTAGDAGKDVVIQRLGIMEDSSFSFTPGQPIFIGADGALTQTVTFPMLRIGLALSTTKIELNPQPFIGV